MSAVQTRRDVCTLGENRLRDAQSVGIDLGQRGAAFAAGVAFGKCTSSSALNDRELARLTRNPP